MSPLAETNRERHKVVDLPQTLQQALYIAETQYKTCPFMEGLFSPDERKEGPTRSDYLITLY